MAPVTPWPDLTVGELLDALLATYEAEGRRSLRSLRSRIRTVRAHLGHLHPLRLDTETVLRYRATRLETVAKITINSELAILRAALRLGTRTTRYHERTGLAVPLVDRRYLPEVPLFPSREADRPRMTFFEEDEIVRLLEELPAHVADFWCFCQLTGWRLSEARRLVWSEVLWDDGVIRPDPENMKAHDPRMAPLVGLVRLLVARARDRAVSQAPGAPVFQQPSGRPIGDFYRSWRSACRRAGITGRRPYDSRRTFARRAVRSGTPLNTILRLGGWTSPDVFFRYAIVDERDLREAGARLYRSPGAARGRRARGR